MTQLSLVGAGLQGFGEIMGGRTQKDQLDFQAKLDDRDANSAQVASQGVAANERKRAKYLQSTALAMQGASGADPGDAQATDQIADIGTEGEMRALNALWTGNTEAAGLHAQATARRHMGGVAKKLGFLKAVGTGVDYISGQDGGTGSFFSKYG